MLRLPEFHYVKPRSLKQAVRLLADFGPEAMVVAGGTDLYPKMKRGQFTPRHVVSLRYVRELKGIRHSGREGIWIGAGETLTALSRDRKLRQLFPALAQAAGLVSTPPLRNMGTLGGNLFVDPRCNYYDQTFFWRAAAGFCLKKDGEICLVAPKSKKCLAVFSSDTAPVLCCLDARAVLVSRQGERRISFEELYQDDGIHFTTKNSDEILRGILIPRPAPGSRNIYLKLRRRGSFDFPVLGVAAALTLDSEGICRSVKIVLTAVSSAPNVVGDAARLLVGRKIDQAAVEEAAEVAARVSHPVDNADMDYWYRKRMTKVYVKRALGQLAGLDLKSPANAEKAV
jgi:4-hydroxybenzoyl-CoA reductase subunit beta